MIFWGRIGWNLFPRQIHHSYLATPFQPSSSIRRVWNGSYAWESLFQSLNSHIAHLDWSRRLIFGIHYVTLNSPSIGSKKEQFLKFLHFSTSSSKFRFDWILTRGQCDTQTNARQSCSYTLDVKNWQFSILTINRFLNQWKFIIGLMMLQNSKSEPRRMNILRLKNVIFSKLRPHYGRNFTFRTSF